MRYHIATYYKWWLSIVGVFSIAYPAAYPYLNPSNLRLQDAAYYAVMALAAAYIYHAHVQSELASVRADVASLRAPQRDNGPPTGPMPTFGGR